MCDVENNDHAERKTNQMIVDMLSKTKWDNGQPPSRSWSQWSLTGER